jgi:hypothetical protein
MPLRHAISRQAGHTPPMIRRRHFRRALKYFITLRRRLLFIIFIDSFRRRRVAISLPPIAFSFRDI